MAEQINLLLVEASGDRRNVLDRVLILPPPFTARGRRFNVAFAK